MWLYFYENTFSLFKRGQEVDKLMNLLQTIEYNLWPHAFFQFESVFYGHSLYFKYVYPNLTLVLC